jgi:hypothetical protein
MGDDHLGGFMTTYNRLSLNPNAAVFLAPSVVHSILSVLLLPFLRLIRYLAVLQTCRFCMPLPTL